MKNIPILAFFLVSLTGYGQLITTTDSQREFCNVILMKNNIEKPTDEMSKALWIGTTNFVYETPFGVFITTREWIVRNKTYRVVTYQYVNETLKKVNALDGYIIYDYSPNTKIFLVRKIEKSLDTNIQRSIMGNDVYTYDFNENKFVFQLSNNITGSKFKVNMVKFVSDFVIQYEYYNKNGNSYEKQTMTIR